jgi:hypothetical protein
MPKCKHCEEFFKRFSCAKTTIGECDCPKCQGYCECYLTTEKSDETDKITNSDVR